MLGAIGYVMGWSASLWCRCVSVIGSRLMIVIWFGFNFDFMEILS